MFWRLGYATNSCCGHIPQRFHQGSSHFLSIFKTNNYTYPKYLPQVFTNMGVSLNGGTPKPSILIGVSIINHPFWGTPIFWKHLYVFVGPKILAYYVTYDRWFEVRPPKKSHSRPGHETFPSDCHGEGKFWGGFELMALGCFFCADGRKGGLEDWTT